VASLHVHIRRLWLSGRQRHPVSLHRARTLFWVNWLPREQYYSLLYLSHKLCVSINS